MSLTGLGLSGLARVAGWLSITRDLPHHLPSPAIINVHHCAQVFYVFIYFFHLKTELRSHACQFFTNCSIFLAAFPNYFKHAISLICHDPIKLVAR